MGIKMKRTHIHAHTFAQSHTYVVWCVRTQYDARVDAKQREWDKREKEVCLFRSSFILDGVWKRCLKMVSLKMVS